MTQEEPRTDVLRAMELARQAEKADRDETVARDIDAGERLVESAQPDD